MQPFWRSSACPTPRQPVCSTMPRRTLRSQPEANNARSREGRSSSATSGNSSSTPTHSRSLQNFHQSVFSILMDLWWNMSRYKYTVKTSIFSSARIILFDSSSLHLESERGYAWENLWPRAASSYSSPWWCRISSLKLTRQNKGRILKTPSWLPPTCWSHFMSRCHRGSERVTSMDFCFLS